MTSYRCAECDRDLRLLAHKVDADGKHWCLGCSPLDEGIADQ